MAEFFDIVDGPSKSDLMFSLFGKNRSTRWSLVFVGIGDSITISGRKTQLRLKITAEIVSAGRTELDDSGEEWRLEGWCQIDADETQKFTARYSTKSRKGGMTTVKVMNVM